MLLEIKTVVTLGEEVAWKKQKKIAIFVLLIWSIGIFFKPVVYYFPLNKKQNVYKNKFANTNLIQ